MARVFVLFSTISFFLCFGDSLSAGEESYELENNLRWKTASEVSNFGFDVYRSRDESGPFDRITDRPMAGAGNSDVPQQYEFVDDTIEPCVVYWYYVESISLDGEREKFTPVFSSRPKPEGGKDSCE